METLVGPAPQGYEYLVDDLPAASTNDDLTDLLNARGAEGWRLLFLASRDIDSVRAFFVREASRGGPEMPPAVPGR
jgi:hypothetical protein